MHKCLLASTLALCLVASAQESPIERRQKTSKPAAEWTLDERIAARFDRASIAERNKAYFAAHPDPIGFTSYSSPPSDTPRVEYVIDGSRNPELFTPMELFEGFVSGVDPRPQVRNGVRRDFSPGFRRLGIDDIGLWCDIDKIAGQLARDRIKGREGFGGEVVMTEVEVCRASLVAFRKVEETLGRDLLYRLLYEVFAPKAFHSSSGNARQPDREIRKREEGCPQ